MCNLILLLNWCLFILFQVFFVISRWFTDIVVEGTFYRFYTVRVQRGLRLGMILFIISEIMFFFYFFWSLLYYSISPSIWIGDVWPPKGIETIDPFSIPFLNTVILVSSGIFVTYAHRVFKCSNLNSENADSRVKFLSGDISKFERWFIDVEIGFLGTIAFGICFIFLQYYEYKYAPFNINDSVYGSIFYLLTGFHGLHVIVGVIFLSVTFFRFYNGHFLTKREYHLGLEFSIWYWHFVDVIWILLFVLLYL